MLDCAAVLKRRRAFAWRGGCGALVAGLLWGAPCLPTALAEVGRVVGNIDGISTDGEQSFLSGRACQQGRKESIQVHTYSSPSATDTRKSVLVTASRANFEQRTCRQQCLSGPCGRQASVFRCLAVRYGPASRLDCAWHPRREQVANEAIAGRERRCGVSVGWDAVSPRPLHPALQALSPPRRHPRVSTTAADLKDLVSRINRLTSFSAKRFHQTRGPNCP